MTTYTIACRLPRGIPPHEALARLQRAGALVLTTWRDAVSGRPFPGLPRVVNEPAYAASLRLVATRRGLHGATVAVVAAYPDWARVEEARPARDLKPALLGGVRARPVRLRLARRTGRVLNPWDQGARYVRVPLRHRDVPPPVQAALWAAGGRLGELGLWGRATHVTALAGLAGPGAAWGVPPTDPRGYTWRTSPWSRLQATGEPEGFLTIRTVSTPRRDGRGRPRGSDPYSWIVGARPAAPVVAAVYQVVQAPVRALVERGA